MTEPESKKITIPVCSASEADIRIETPEQIRTSPDVVVDPDKGVITIKIMPIDCDPGRYGRIVIPVEVVGESGYCLDEEKLISWERVETAENVFASDPTVTILNPGCCHWRGSIVRRKNMPGVAEIGDIYWEVRPVEIDGEPHSSEKIETQNIPIPGCELELSYEFTNGQNLWQDIVDSTYWCSACFTGGFVTAVHGDYGNTEISYSVNIMGDIRTCRPSDFVPYNVGDWVFVAYLSIDCAELSRTGSKKACDQEKVTDIGIIMPLRIGGYSDGNVHDYIDFETSELPKMLDTAIISGQIIEIDRLQNQADVETAEYGRITDVPFFYHCHLSQTVEDGHQAFEDNDEVVLLCEGAKTNKTPEIKIVSFSNELKSCETPCVVFRCGKAPDTYEVVWDLKANRFFEIMDGASPVTYPVSTATMSRLGFYTGIRYATGPIVEMYEKFQNPHDLSAVPVAVKNARMWISGPSYIPVGDLLAKRVVEYPGTMYHEPFLPDNFSYNSRIDYDGARVDTKSWLGSGLARNGESHQWGITTSDPGGLTCAWFEYNGEIVQDFYWWVNGQNYDVFRAGRYEMFPIQHAFDRSYMLRVNTEFAGSGGLSGLHLERFAEYSIEYKDDNYQSLIFLDYLRRFVIHSPFGPLLETKFHAIRTGELYTPYSMDTHNFFQVPVELTANTQDGFVIQAAYSAALRHEIGSFIHTDNTGQPIGWKPPEMFPGPLWYPNDGVMAKQRPFSGVDVGYHVSVEYNRNTASVNPLEMDRKPALESAIQQLVEESVERIGPENNGLTFSKPQIIKCFYSKS